MLHSCPCGYQSKRENVKRHMSTCKRIKAAERVTDGISDVNERLVVTEEKLAAKEALLDAATKRASELTEENSSLKNENKQLKKQVKEKASTTVNITNNITNNINVTIAPFQEFLKNGAASLCQMPAVPDDQRFARCYLLQRCQSQNTSRSNTWRQRLQACGFQM